MAIWPQPHYQEHMANLALWVVYQVLRSTPLYIEKARHEWELVLLWCSAHSYEISIGCTVLTLSANRKEHFPLPGREENDYYRVLYVCISSLFFPAHPKTLSRPTSKEDVAKGLR